MQKIYSKKTKQKVRSLRSQGWSLGEISLKTRIPKNTLSGWFKDIQLTKYQKARIKQKIIDSSAIRRALAVKVNREKVEKWKFGIREKVKHYRQLATKNHEISKLICGVLYLCEGAKYPSSRYLHFGNADPAVIATFITLLRKYFNIDEAKLRFDVGYRWDQDYTKLKRYWSEITNIPISQSLNNKPDKRTKGKPTLKKGYMGICRVIYYSASLQFELQSIGETIIKGRL